MLIFELGRGGVNFPPRCSSLHLSLALCVDHFSIIPSERRVQQCTRWGRTPLVWAAVLQLDYISPPRQGKRYIAQQYAGWGLEVRWGGKPLVWAVVLQWTSIHPHSVACEERCFEIYAVKIWNMCARETLEFLLPLSITGRNMANLINFGSKIDGTPPTWSDKSGWGYCP